MKIFFIIYFCVLEVFGHSEKHQLFNEKAEPRIVNGTKANPKDFPWMAALFTFKNDNSLMGCGGSLITDRVILTAAHCVDNAEHGYAILGVLNEQDGYVIKYEKVTVHARYDITYKVNDIALIHLAKPAPIDNEYIKIIPLNVNPNLDNTEATISGWGRISNDELGPGYLLYTFLNVISNEECSQYDDDLFPTKLCAKGKGLETTCKGDNGGPLVSDWPKNPVQIGIVSYGANEDCELGTPVVYTRVSKYLQWIEKNINNND